MDITVISAKQRFINEFTIAINRIISKLLIANFQEGVTVASDYNTSPKTEALHIQATLAHACAASHDTKKLKQSDMSFSEATMVKTGERIYLSSQRNKSTPIICDTAACLALYLAHQCIARYGHAEIINDSRSRHTWLLVNRNLTSSITMPHTWGGESFIVDIWQPIAKNGLITSTRKKTSMELAGEAFFLAQSRSCVDIGLDLDKILSVAVLSIFEPT
ncbi:hypothetical protein [Pelagibaculum spongiae]|uniref:Uncharacterized protein n=1 Tax=Pelagibaculum spongiae TaxID=2080658 RepID=A0A2V1GZW6_9GAMM|nr:hypothetical protein [Pelagibaculum spongiae]PVZ68952.1 hypothetical protein DC094_11950 [Pelagibaculum spongiae]